MTSRACARHREALADLADLAVPGPAGAAAIAHVGRCPDCAELLGDLMLTVVALRRMAAPSAAAADAFVAGTTAAPEELAGSTDSTWTRLLARIERSRRAAREQAWRWRTSLGGMLASALVVATLVGPATLRLGADGSFAAATGADIDIVSSQIEADYDAGAHAPPPTPADLDVASGEVGIRRYPDDLRPIRKEVAPARSTGLSPDAR